MNMLKSYASALIVAGLLPSCATDRSGDSLETRVSNLVDQTTRSDKLGRRAYEELEALGTQGVPHLVGHLGDEREVATSEIALVNHSPDAFEGIRHYRPKTVHEALSAVLNQVTGQSFVFVYNGAPQPEHERNRRAWIDWCISEYPEHATTCKGH